MVINNEKKAPKSSKKMFISGVLALTIANILVKSVGLISKIVLNRVVGSVGAGYYSSAYEIYAYLYVISTSGLPVALSILVSRSRVRGRIKEAKKIFDISFIALLVIGLLFSVLMMVFSNQIAGLIGAPKTALCIIAIAPTMLFICLSSSLRGYFQGFQLMTPTAASQLIEAVCKVGIGVGFALWAKSRGYDDYVVSAYTILGVTIGVLLGMIYLYIKKLFFKEKSYVIEQILKELFVIAIPITLSSSVLSLTTVIDTLMVQNRLLWSGMNEITVRVYYGDYTSLVISMFNLPTIFFYPIANALIPLMSGAFEAKNEQRSELIRKISMKIIILIAMPCAVGLGIFSYPILNLLMFNSDSVNRAAPWLSIAAASVLFLGIISATNAFLNSAGRQKLPIISMLVGAGAKLISNYILLDKIGMLGAPISTVICYLTASALNIYFTIKHVGKIPNLIRIFTLPLIASILSIGTSALIFIGISIALPIKIATILSILLAVIMYVVLIFKIKAISREDILLVPRGEKLLKFLSKMGFLAK